jgi:hypothetical protein
MKHFTLGYPHRKWMHSPSMKSSSLTKFIVAIGLTAMGLTIAAAGIYIGETDDAPGAALIGILVALGMIAFGVMQASSKTKHP